MPTKSDALFKYDRDLSARYVCGADEAGHGAWAGPLVVAAVRFDYERLDAAAEARLEHLYDSKERSDSRKAALFSVIMEVADEVAVVVVSAAQIDQAGLGPSTRRAFTRALEAVAVSESVRLVDGSELKGVEDAPQAVKKGDQTSAAIAAASIIAKVSRDELMRDLDAAYPGYEFATQHGYGGGNGSHKEALKELGLSPVHRRSSDGCKPYLPGE
jgi:ribonuclease HII